MKLLRGICLGSKGAGKTSILAQMQHRHLGRIHPTVGIDFAMFVHKDVRFQCWDASGDSKYRNVAKIFAKDCVVMFYVFDITSQDSLDEAIEWRKTIETEAQMHFLIGNKADKLERAPGIPTILAQYPDMMYYETSTQRRTTLEQMFDSILLATAHLTRVETLSVDATRTQSRECCTLC